VTRRLDGEAVLEVERLTVAYGDVPVVRGASLSLAAGEVAALVGPNGAGKTTLVSAVAGLLRRRATAVRLFGEDILGLRAHQIAERGLALIPQGRQLFPAMTVSDNLRLGAYCRRARAGAEARLDVVLDRFPVLRQRTRQQAGSLSGGEQQMLTIARALMSDPRVVVLDEPSLGLAPLVVAEVAAIVQQLRAEGLTVLLVEQNIPLAFELADHVYLLEQGTVADRGTPAELRSRTSIEAAYLGRV
jgi:branched-chain amino acid transport system ATP-binding protein